MHLSHPSKGFCIFHDLPTLQAGNKAGTVALFTGPWRFARSSPHMSRKPDPYGRDARRPYHIPLRGWQQVIQRVWTESGRDNLSVVAAGCAFFALFAIFPALTALISLYGLTANPTTVEHQFGIFAEVLPAQAYDIVLQQIRRIAEASGQSLGWSLGLSLILAFWSATAGTQALFAALNIANEEPERRTIFQFYLSAFGFTLAGILGGVVMLARHRLCADLVCSLRLLPHLRTLGRDRPLAVPGAAHFLPALASLSLWSVPPRRQMALGDRWLNVRHHGLATCVRGLLLLCRELCPLRPVLRFARRSDHSLILALYLLLHRAARRRDKR